MEVRMRLLRCFEIAVDPLRVTNASMMSHIGMKEKKSII